MIVYGACGQFEDSKDKRMHWSLLYFCELDLGLRLGGLESLIEGSRRNVGGG